MFRVSQHLSSGVLKTVTAASGTFHNIGTATSLQRGQVGTVLTSTVNLQQNKSSVASPWIFINTDWVNIWTGLGWPRIKTGRGRL